MNSKKTQAIQKWPTSTNVKEIQGFLRLTNYYRKYIRNYSNKATSLSNMIKKKIEFHGNDKAQKVFDDLKKEFRKKNIFANFDPELEEIVEANAFNKGIKKMYNQIQQNKKLRFVAFYLRKFSSTEMNYEIHDKKLLIIVKCFKQGKIYLKKLKYEVKVYTNHKNFLYFTKTKTLNKKQVRGAEKMSRYNYKIIYKKGEENERADVLSRRFDHFESAEEVNTALFKKTEDGKKFQFNKCYLMTTSKIETDEAFIKRIKETQAKNKNCEKWFDKQPKEFIIHEEILHF